ncbi:inovirus-type Gp2 protein [Pseudomonas sp. KB_15]|uniref:YagK/YfjJ domain-containing protein n=1 Tax=Pseudomonas sp. KB_15 TaxID=3233035 RepID=UPI003F98103A
MKKTKNQKAKKNVTYSPTYQGLKINTGKFKNLGVYTIMLKPMLGQINALLTHHSRVQLLRFDLHLPVVDILPASSANLVVSNFFKQVKQDLASANWSRQKNVIQGWTREIGESNNAHYHCYIGVSSTVPIGTFYDNTPTQIWKLIYSRWKDLSGGSVRPSGHHVVNRFNHEQLSTAFYHLSYLCKVRSKDFGTGEPHKRYSNSRLKPKKVADQQVITDCHPELLELFFIPTASPDMVISPQL